jgi:hypothetical protein
MTEAYLDLNSPEYMTLQAIRSAIILSRIDMPFNKGIYDHFDEITGEFNCYMFNNYKKPEFDADAVQIKLIKIIALAIRLLEEGDPDTDYAGVKRKT